MTIKLDLKDKKILYELDVNSRQSNSEIARKVGLSKQVVGFRIKKLIENEVISFFFTVIDVSKLGRTIHKNFLRLQNLDRKKENSLIKYLKESGNVAWLASCDGKYDLAFGVWVSDLEELDRFLKDLNKKFGKYISERVIATILHGEYFVRDYLVDGRRKYEGRESFFGAVPAPVKMNGTDWNVLYNLARESRKSAVDIAERVGVKPEVVIGKIRKLEKSGVVKHYNVVPNESEYPYHHYKVLIGLKNISEDRERDLMEYCRAQKNIVYVVKSLGPWEFEIDLEVESAAAFREAMMDIKTKFKDILKDYSALTIYKVHKYNFCPSVGN